eukprot:m.381281 g.381281  ORF g.381281 m.381281 type:complete len:80 (-) comp16714_c0_seq7:371-610(-)
MNVTSPGCDAVASRSVLAPSSSTTTQHELQSTLPKRKTGVRVGVPSGAPLLHLTMLPCRCTLCEIALQSIACLETISHG